MGLFHRKEIPQTEVLYTVTASQGDTTLVVGLGNAEKKYAGTRHNIGFLCADGFVAAGEGTWVEKKSLKCHLSELRLGQRRVIVIKPTTFMNRSGEAVRAVQQFYKITNEQTIVIHDELAIPFGHIRTRAGGSSAGNNGIKSLIEHIGDNFGRIRIGIKNEFSDTSDAADFVLQKFTKTEQAHIVTLTTEVNAILNEAIFGGLLPADTRTFL